ncbi:unnamed protein product [Ranitomeya imitator]|uniref:Lysophospholipid acyltransferase 5 n=1 Tax=Ranitomeya imitator TaxID=111125 RepID=A0ABN9L378_9NEOB|nr:unnamed protein product [Ranitomeya imitator]
MGRTVTAVLTSFCFQMDRAIYCLATTTHPQITMTSSGRCRTAFSPSTDRLCGDTAQVGSAGGVFYLDSLLDYYDGGKAKTSLSADQQRCAVDGSTHLAGVCGFSYYYGGFLVGPQFSMCSYQKLVTGELTDVEGQRPNSVQPAMKRLCLASSSPRTWCSAPTCPTATSHR